MSGSTKLSSPSALQVLALTSVNYLSRYCVCKDLTEIHEVGEAYLLSGFQGFSPPWSIDAEPVVKGTKMAARSSEEEGAHRMVAGSRQQQKGSGVSYKPRIHL